MKSLVIILLILCTTPLAWGQSQRVQGTVIDEETGEPIIGAQIFYTGTTIGTISTENGVFYLPTPPSNTAELSIQFLGYASKTITIKKNRTYRDLVIELTPIVLELDEITVKPDTDTWLYNVSQFKQSFLGIGPFSKGTRILNEEVLIFNFDADTRVLTARALDKLRIENKELGYDIDFYLDHFEIDYANRTTIYLGRPFFKERNSKRSRTRKKWETNRETAYKGSFLQFTRAMMQDSLETCGFTVYGEQREENATYVSKDPIDVSQVFGQHDNESYYLSFINLLNVDYKYEKEDPRYLIYSNRMPSGSIKKRSLRNQNSSLALRGDSLFVDAYSGLVINPEIILFDGYWGFEKLSDMLPLDYKLSEFLDKKVCKE
ncbi:MAG: carboxypeptidase-like regulatory domain-containing protein [Bacteroidota bacterium]